MIFARKLVKRIYNTINSSKLTFAFSQNTLKSISLLFCCCFFAHFDKITFIPYFSLLVWKLSGWDLCHLNCLNFVVRAKGGPICVSETEFGHQEASVNKSTWCQRSTTCMQSPQPGQNLDTVTHVCFPSTPRDRAIIWRLKSQLSWSSSIWQKVETVPPECTGKTTLRSCPQAENYAARL